MAVWGEKYVDGLAPVPVWCCIFLFFFLMENSRKRNRLICNPYRNIFFSVGDIWWDFSVVEVVLSFSHCIETRPFLIKCYNTKHKTPQACVCLSVIWLWLCSSYLLFIILCPLPSLMAVVLVTVGYRWVCTVMVFESEVILQFPPLEPHGLNSAECSNRLRSRHHDSTAHCSHWTCACKLPC